MQQKQITQKEAKEKYGIVISNMQKLDKVKFYLQDNGNVIDSNGDTRFVQNKKIKIPFSEEDLQELLNGETFDWTFDGVDVHLYMGYDDNDGQDCIKCGNPKIMYYCNECENNQETAGECETCGHAGGVKYTVVEDKHYHDTCN